MEKKTKQNKKQKQKGRAPLLGLAKSIYYAYANILKSGEGGSLVQYCNTFGRFCGPHKTNKLKDFLILCSSFQ